MSFIFYDTETTGTNTSFDQILQFGAIKTDYELNEIDRFEIRCRLLPFVLPAPGALRVTGITIEQALDPSLPTHYQMVNAIKAKLEEWSPAIFIGHNSLGFDEHLLRQAFYKSLHSPYLTNTNGNGRADSLRMIQAVSNFAPDLIAIPIGPNGKKVFKLDQLAPLNGFDHTNAHDAMADVEATIHMCRLIAERAPEFWSHFVRFSQKASATDYALDEDVFLQSEFYFGKPYNYMVTALGPNPDNGAEILVFDLMNDPDELRSLDSAELVSRLKRSPKPVRALKTNAGPIILAYDDIPPHMRDGFPDKRMLRDTAANIKNDSAFAERLIEAYLESKDEYEQSEHIEEQIYDGFASRQDQSLMERFHQLEWPERPGLLAKITDSRIKSFGNRIIYSEAPEIMTEAARLEYEHAIAVRLMAEEGTVPWLTYPKAIADTLDLLSSADDSERSLLQELHDYLSQEADKAASLIA